MKGLLSGMVRLVMLQFSFSNVAAVPEGLFKKAKESLDKLVSRKSEVQGRQFIAPTKDVSVLMFVGDLIAAGYVLVDAFYQMRSNAQGQNFPVVRFIFAVEEDVRTQSEFFCHKQVAQRALAQICGHALWRVQGFLNPFVREGILIDGCHSVAINCVARNPLIDIKGDAILRWQKDEAGERIGNGPVPIEPKLFLRIQEDDICVM